MIFPTLFPFDSINHKLSSGPEAMPARSPLAPGIGNSVNVPLGVILPILFELISVNHKLLSGPKVIS